MTKDCRTLEFFEGPDHRLSITSLLKFAAFFPASVIAYKLASTEALAVYLTAYVLDSLGGKMSDAMKGRKSSPTVSVSEGPTTVNVKAKK